MEHIGTRTSATVVAMTATLTLAACGSLSSPAATTDDTPSPTPSATATATPTEEATATASPTPTPTATASPQGVLGDAQECENEDLLYEVDYPEGWWANERVEPDHPSLTPIPSCNYFAPEPVELQPNAGLPQGIAIWFDLETQFEPTGSEVDGRETEIDGRPTLVVETEATAGGFEPEGTLTYRYVIDMGDGSELIVSTSTLYIDDEAYEETRPILDAMMETLDLDD